SGLGGGSAERFTQFEGPGVVPRPPPPLLSDRGRATPARRIDMSAPVNTPPPLAIPDYNRSGVDFRRPIPRPKVKGLVIDFHCHLLARRHAEPWFEAADHYGIDCFLSMSQLEEVVALLRDYTGRIQFIAVPK